MADKRGLKVVLLGVLGCWRDVADAARTTIGKEAGEGEPSSGWKRRMLLAEHSPVRLLQLRWKWTNLRYWVSVHFTRHKIGIEHWVRSQRTDRTKVDRDVLPQSSLIEHECLANPQAVITVSRRRLCRQASPETRDAWKAVVAEMAKAQPELASACVPDCVYRGWCYEYRSCGYHRTLKFRAALDEYRRGVNGHDEDWAAGGGNEGCAR
jgi:hypothetical protein